MNASNQVTTITILTLRLKGVIPPGLITGRWVQRDGRAYLALFCSLLWEWAVYGTPIEMESGHLSLYTAACEELSATRKLRDGTTPLSFTTYVTKNALYFISITGAIEGRSPKLSVAELLSSENRKNQAAVPQATIHCSVSVCNVSSKDPWLTPINSSRLLERNKE